MTIDLDEFESNLWSRIQILNSTIWENRVLKSKVDNWLNNFSKTEEKLMALYLLSEFMYFGDSQMRILLKTLFRDLFKYPIIKAIRESNGNTLEKSVIESAFNDELKKTRFIGVGNPSESGAHLLYFFRQENNLSKNNFIHSFEIDLSVNQNIKRLVFLDDFCGSGSQVSTNEDLTRFIDYLRTNRIGIEINYLMLVGTETGIDKIEKTRNFNNVNAVMRLDNSFRVFDKNSRYFNNVDVPLIMDEVKIFAQTYGYPLIEQLCKNEGVSSVDLHACASSNSLGYSDCQLLLGFHHNTPDNTLPIIWYDEKDYPWTPIFKRYNKKHNF